jgi:hypothetical protein
MLPSRSLLLGLTLLAGGCAADSFDFPDLGSYSQPCDPFACRPARAVAPVKCVSNEIVSEIYIATHVLTSFSRDFEFTANGCGTSGMPISTSVDFQQCCNWHDAVW